MRFYNIFTSKQHFYHLILVLIILVSAGIRLSAINRSVRIDESNTLMSYAIHPPTDFLFDFSDTNNHFPNTLLMHIQYRLLGNDEDWKLRVHVLVIGLMVTVATYYAGKELYDADVGLIASALTSVLYLLVEFSINARGYIFIALITLLVLIVIHRARQQTDKRLWGVVGLLAAAGFWVSPIFLYTMGGLGLWTLATIILENIGKHRRHVLLYFIGAMILGAVITVTYYGIAVVTTYSNVETLSNSSLIEYTQEKQATNYLTDVVRPALESLFVQSHRGIPDWGIILMLVGAVMGLVLHTRVAKHRAPIILPMVFWLVLQIGFQRTFIITRLFVFLMPIYALLIGAGWLGLIRVLKSRRIPPIATGLVISAVIIIPISFNLISNRLIFTSTITGYMPAVRDLADSLKSNPAQLESPIYLTEVYANILNYYIWRDDIDVNIQSISWENNALRDVLVDKSEIVILHHAGLGIDWLLDPFDADISGLGVVLHQRDTTLVNPYALYDLHIGRPNISPRYESNGAVIEDWTANQAGVDYSLGDDGTLSFRLGGENWTYLKNLRGKYWRDYTLSFRVKITKPSDNFEDLIIRFRDKDDRSFGLAIDSDNIADESNVGFRMDLDGKFINYFVLGNSSIEVDEWFEVRLELSDTIYTAFIDDEQIIQWDASLLTEGTLGFLVPPIANIEVTEIKIE